MRIWTTAAVCLLALGGSACSGPGSRGGTDCDTYKFPTREWRKTKDRHDDEAVEIRRNAADALVKCRVLQRKTKRQVLRTLGRPDLEHRIEYKAFDYYIGPERGDFVLDDEILEVTFKRGRVTKATLYDG